MVSLVSGTIDLCVHVQGVPEWYVHWKIGNTSSVERGSTACTAKPLAHSFLSETICHRHKRQQRAFSRLVRLTLAAVDVNIAKPAKA